MKVGERGRVTIPKKLRERFGIRPGSEVAFAAGRDAIILKPRRLRLDRWKGCCRDSFAKLGYRSVDAFLDDLRGR